MAVVFWHNLNEDGGSQPSDPDADSRGDAPPSPVEQAMAQIALMAADNPALAAGYSMAMLSHDADVGRIRVKIGRTMHDRLAAALAVDPRLSGPVDDVLSTLLVVLTGGLVQAGMGHLQYDELPGVFERAVTQILGPRSDAPPARSTESRPPERRPE